MDLGIDVGGTFTDAVAVHQGKVVAACKTMTTENIMEGIKRIIQDISQEVPVDQWKRLVISTTILTNILAQNLMDPIAMLIMTGPGITPKSLKLPSTPFFIQGAINFRGQEIQGLVREELVKKTEEIYQQGFRHVAVVGKFSGRNRIHEIQAAEYLKSHHPDLEITLGHQVSGNLNFPRRCATAWLTAATKGTYSRFLRQLKSALTRSQVFCPVFIMKADGGVIPLNAAEDHPGETVYSGPATSSIGASVMAPGKSAVIIDVGGTTTDLSLMLSGSPLIASRGLKINGLLTHIRSLALKPVSLGGDSPVDISPEGQPLLGEKRKEQAACFGGRYPTLTDAVNIVHHVPGDNLDLSRKAFGDIPGIEPNLILDFAQRVISSAADKVAGGIKQMIKEWQEEPAYQVWQIMQQSYSFPPLLVGLGGGAPIITQEVAKRLNMEPYIPSHHQVANALGCAVAKPSLTLKLHIDTVEHRMVALEEGWQQEFREELSEKRAVEWAKKMLVQRAEKYYLPVSPSDIELVNYEFFSVIQGYRRTGAIIDVEVQIRPDIVKINL